MLELRYARHWQLASVILLLLVLIGAGSLSDQLGAWTGSAYIRFGIPTVVVALFALMMFYLVNRQRTADFLIATEGEMKKVSWSSFKEVWGSTKVVIVFAFILVSVLFAVDLLFIFTFEKLGVMG